MTIIVKKHAKMINFIEMSDAIKLYRHIRIDKIGNMKILKYGIENRAMNYGDI
jgi:hypothetical protein